MALAILDFLTAENGQVKFSIDTGTNKYYYLKIGKSVVERDGLRWLDEVTSKTPLRINENSDNLFNSAKEISVPSGYFNDKSCYVQMYSLKDKEGKSPAFSRVIKVPIGLMDEDTINEKFSLPESVSEIPMTSDYFFAQRNIPHTDPRVFSKETSVEDILATIVKAATPIVMGLLSGMKNTTPANGTQSANVPQLGTLNTILDAILHGLSGTKSIPALSLSHSMARNGDNRFINGNANLSNQFIFGIDDAIIATLLPQLTGPVLQALPGLLNSANQYKLQNKAATNKLMTDLVADTNRRLMLQEFLNQQAATPNNNIDLNQLLQLLQQMPAVTTTAPANTTVPANTTTPTTPATPSVTKSLSFRNYIRTLSTKTILSFETAAKVNISGKDYAVYSRNSDIKLKLKLNVVEPVPKNPLPKAIIKFCFKDNTNNKVLEKVFKEKNIAPNTPLEFNFTSTEIKVIPGNTPVNVYAEMRWLTSQNKEHSTFGYSDIILAGDYIFKEQGEALIGEKELTDMNVYRSFWNKVWESPVLDKIKSDNEGIKKSLWELNAILKYSFVYSADNQSNGLMETKMLVGEKDPDSLRETVEGRMKAGIEISISELNKLCSLWDKQPVLTPEKLDALRTEALLKNNTSEFIYNIKLQGRANERAIVWVVPILKLFNITLNKIKSVDQWGQVTETEEEKVQFPLPVSARILGIKTA